ncbi:MAG: hypothetical protein LPK58_06455 [Gammaproteobacteria bacterium]|nr:hypothetical protein [Gammaproteobacteria bacterium]MDX5375215.1 hypothetical protein [Gammaproteobacteria bacterium]
MSSKRYAPLSVELTPSRPLAALLILGTLAGIPAIGLAALPWWARLLALVLLLVSIGEAWRRHVRPVAAGAVRRFGRDGEGRWWVETSREGRQAAVLLPGSTRFPGLLILQFRTAGARRAEVVLTPGRTAAWRRLCVALRHETSVDAQ